MSQNLAQAEREASLQRMIRDLEVEMERLVAILANDARLH